MTIKSTSTWLTQSELIKLPLIRAENLVEILNFGQKLKKNFEVKKSKKFIEFLTENKDFWSAFWYKIETLAKNKYFGPKKENQGQNMKGNEQKNPKIPVKNRNFRRSIYKGNLQKIRNFRSSKYEGKWTQIPIF